MVTFGELGPELVKVWQLDQVPDIAEGSWDYRGFGDGRGSWDTGRHDGVTGLFVCAY